MDPIPVQILDAVQVNDDCIQVSIMCCFCGKKHFHGAGLGLGAFPAGTSSLGIRSPHCATPNACFLPAYELRLDAWRACGKEIKRKPARGKKPRH